MKIWVTKTSDYHYGQLTECENLKDIIDNLLKESGQLVISKVPDYYSEEAKQGEYKIEIYDYWRE